ncbi:MAG: molybdenum cofactor guanylyltransferase [Pseudomonadales bacterium]|nr:molybdenum cofactor guanylyltransferase [Pseudomonadales bacterium]
MLYSVLLAGGRSSRMGQNKALLKWRGQTLLDRALALLQGTGSDRIFLSGQFDGYDCIADLVPNAGPLGGIYSTLALIRTEYVLDGSLLLVVPVDMPLLSSNALARLLVNMQGRQAVRYENEMFPCALRTSEALHDYLHEQLFNANDKRGLVSMGALLHYLQADSISSKGLEPEVFLNVNRPEDWLKMQHMSVGQDL